MINININGQSGKSYRVKRSYFLDKVFKDKKIGINMLCSVFFAVSAAVVIIFCLNAFFKRIYSRQEAFVNSSGAIVNTMNNKEVSLWLYNPTQIMENSGIRVAKGDWIKISASGSYHSGIQSEEFEIVETDTEIKVHGETYTIPPEEECRFTKITEYFKRHGSQKDTANPVKPVRGIVNAAKTNTEPTYKWVPQYNQKRDKKEEYASAINKDVNYGTLLVGIMDEFDNPERPKDDNPARKVLDFKDLKDDLKPTYKYRRWKRVPKDGTLHFIINDSAYIPEFYSDNLGETLVSVEIRYRPNNFWILIIASAIMLVSGTLPFILQYFSGRRKLPKHKSH